MACWICGLLPVLLVGGLTAFLCLANTGLIRLPLPGPAHGSFVHPMPPGVLQPSGPLTGDFAPNNRLAAAVRLFVGAGIHGPESVVVGPSGQLVMLDRTNALHQAWPDGEGGWRLEQQPLARLGAGRPLGYHFDADGNLIVADSLKGLIKYDYASREVTLLASHVSPNSPIDPGSEITYANDLAIAADGTVLFTSCTDIVPPLNSAGYYDTYRAWLLDLLRGLPRGRLLRYDPASRETTAIAKGFFYANGVALSRDGSYVVMAETDRLRVWKIWVQGDNAGKKEVLIDNLPGVPDGVDAASPSPAGGEGPGGDGSAFWISLVSAAPPFNSPLLGRFLHSPLVRAAAAWAPPGLRPGLRRWTAVVKVDGAGRVLDFLLDETGAAVTTVSAVSESGGRLWLGNLAGSYVSFVDLQQDS